MSSLKGINIKVIERKSNWYHRLLVVDGIIVGAQLVGRTSDIGPLVNAIRRKDTLEGLRRVIGDGNLLSKNPLCFKLFPYIGQLV
jgi:NAD(P)H-nitrite reductase large subunit